MPRGIGAIVEWRALSRLAPLSDGHKLCRLITPLNSPYAEFRSYADLVAEFGQIDIYLFDQLLRGRIAPRHARRRCRVRRRPQPRLLLQERFDIFGVDADPRRDRSVRAIANGSRRAARDELQGRARRADDLSRTRSPTSCLSSAVLHFARDDAQFDGMLREMWRVLRPGGLLFCRLASDIGMETRMQRIEGRRCLLPDGSERYLVDQAMLLWLTATLAGVSSIPSRRRSSRTSGA